MRASRTETSSRAKSKRSGQAVKRLDDDGANTIDLNGYFLSDDPAELTKWSFPTILLEPDSFLIVFASGKDTVGTELHSSFKLSRNGETIVLTDPGNFEVDRLEMPYLHADHSYGSWPDGGTTFYFDDPSPRESNTTITAYNGYTPQPFVSTPSGFYDGSISVELSDLQGDADIHYTLDGNLPDTGTMMYSRINLRVHSRKVSTSSGSRSLPS